MILNVNKVNELRSTYLRLYISCSFATKRANGLSTANTAAIIQYNLQVSACNAHQPNRHY